MTDEVSDIICKVKEKQGESGMLMLKDDDDVITHGKIYIYSV